MIEDRWAPERDERVRCNRSGNPCNCQIKYQSAREQRRKIICEMSLLLSTVPPRHQAPRRQQSLSPVAEARLTLQHDPCMASTAGHARPPKHKHTQHWVRTENKHLLTSSHEEIREAGIAPPPCILACSATLNNALDMRDPTAHPAPLLLCCCNSTAT